ncbi:adenosylcobyric acid synthase (glutamine-hydrolysing) [Stella humosa]|uniref:Cobyric acid synthase n=1 Tax=Stella humosa TaxID=94 RepID=A0A3N1LCH0_9PROT|nr:cobyric acid synthase [Stella humosa]ROP90731.1 adenosylcobyric acid synthase (glutamine-hydrolysing) [Stella humosa]BBK29369.1 cobyric acid synthase [Stella humosa]
MLQGTGSDVGKSILVAGLGRAFTRRGLRVLPFKPQNMANNAAVTPDGGEIGRAQFLQARACRVPASRDMNPVLLKPEADRRAQVIVRGDVAGGYDAGGYHRLKPDLLPIVRESFQRLAADADLVLVEGAGSPAEVNLRQGDIANMGFALAEQVSVVLVADIDRGGMLASVVGTMALLPPDERALIAGYLVNKFRGDPALLAPAFPIIAGHCGLPCLGVVPWLAAARALPAEDAVSTEADGGRSRGGFLVAVPMLPRIANFDDLDPLKAEDGVSVVFVPPGRPIPAEADLVVIPGSKATRADLAFLQAEGWDVDIHAHVRRGGAVLGLCGGYQMLGASVADPDGVEGAAGTSAGLGLLAVDTVMAGRKHLAPATGSDPVSGEAVRGYEMHMGVTDGADRARPFLTVDGRTEGAQSSCGRIMGTYLHGLFAADGFRRAFLARLGAPARRRVHYEATVDAALDAIADLLESEIDLDRLLDLAGRRPVSAATTG